MTTLLLLFTVMSASSSIIDCFDQVMREQEVGGKIFFLDGTGAWGNPTPQNVAYGAAKRAITQVKVRRGAHMLGSAEMASWLYACVWPSHTTDCAMCRLEIIDSWGSDGAPHGRKHEQGVNWRCIST